MSAPDPARPTDTRAPEVPALGGGYARYVLAILFVVMVFNFLDRQILSILADQIKADLGVSDSQLGFLYGTVFAVFFAIFGIPLGRLADVWRRTSLVSAGLAVWSMMTALSGLATGFGLLAAARIGVGVGEASAGPASHSILSDYFPKEIRASVLAVFTSGIYFGAGLGVLLGGLIVGAWREAFPDGDAPFGLRGWQVAFFAVGVPGLLLALWVRTLREPVRGQSEGIFTDEESPSPWKVLRDELATILPPFTFFHLARQGSGLALRNNFVALAVITAVAVACTRWLGDVEQWVALGIGLYAAYSWSQVLSHRDPPAYGMIFGTRSLRYLSLAFGFLAFTGFGFGFWGAPFFLRTHGVPEEELGPILGGAAMFGGLLGVMAGGVVSDRLRRRTPNGRLHVALVTAVVPLPLIVWLLNTPTLGVAYALNFVVLFLSSMYIGPGISTVQDLMLPRMRATASAAYLLAITFIGLALGPYVIGRLSEALGDLGLAMQLSLIVNVVAAAMILLAMRHLPRDENTRIERARALGETNLRVID